MRHHALAILFAASAFAAAPDSPPSLKASAGEQRDTRSPEVSTKGDGFVPVTDAMLENPNPADWLMVSRTYDEQRFSPLDQINRRNVAQLRMAWSRGLPVGTQESTPIVYRGVMYLFAPGASI